MRRYTHRVEGSKKEEEEKKGKLLQSSFQFPILPFLLDDRKERNYYSKRGGKTPSIIPLE